MKKLVLFFALMLSTSSLMAQRVQETVYLKNGGVVKGEIVEQVPNESLKIRTKDGNVFVYRMDEVEKIAKETPSVGDETNSKHRGLDFTAGLGYDIATKGGGGNLAAELELGKRVSEKFYWGIGAGAYIPTGDGDMMIPITADFKVFMPNSSKITPLVGLKAGYVLNTADDVTVGSGKTSQTIEMPDYIMVSLMPGIQYPLSKTVDFQLGAGYTHFIPTKGSTSSGAVSIRAAFNFHKSSSPEPRRPRIPTRDNGFQLTLEADGFANPKYNFHSLAGVGPAIVLGYKLNPNLSVGLGFNASFLSVGMGDQTTTYFSGADGTGDVLEHFTSSQDDHGASDDITMYKYFLRGQYRLNDERFSPFISVDLGLRNYTFDDDEDIYWHHQGIRDTHLEEINLMKSSIFITPAIGFSVRTTNNSYFEMRLGYELTKGFEEQTWNVNLSRNDGKKSAIYTQKTIPLSSLFLSIGWTHTFGSRKR